MYILLDEIQQVSGWERAVNSLSIDYDVDAESKVYIQVTQSIMDDNVRNREIRALAAIDDNYPKMILSMDHHFFVDYEGIQFKNIIEYLLEL